MRGDELIVKGALQSSGIPGIDWVINPYVGCTHACLYCYAVFMKRVYHYQEPWGDFLAAKVNIADLLWKERRKIKPGQVVFLSSVTDPYVPQEKQYRLTRGCLEALVGTLGQIRISTRSPLVLRDLDLLKALGARVGFSVTTDREEVAKAFEPKNPSIKARVAALRTLHQAGLETYAFIGPLLPHTSPEAFAALLDGAVDSVYVDRMNYVNAGLRALYERFGQPHLITEAGARKALKALTDAFEVSGIPVTNIPERNETFGIVRPAVSPPMRLPPHPEQLSLSFSPEPSSNPPVISGFGGSHALIVV